MSEATHTDAPVVIDLTDGANALAPPIRPAHAEIQYVPHLRVTARDRGWPRRRVARGWCGEGRPTFFGGDQVVPGGRLLVVINADATVPYLALVSSVATTYELGIDVYSLRPAHRGGASEPLDTSSARRVARQLATATGREVHWDVLYGPAGTSVKAIVAATPASAVALPHLSHGRRSCSVVRLAAGISVPVLLA
jgi:hypothetical protein